MPSKFRENYSSIHLKMFIEGTIKRLKGGSRLLEGVILKHPMRKECDVCIVSKLQTLQQITSVSHLPTFIIQTVWWHFCDETLLICWLSKCTFALLDLHSRKMKQQVALVPHELRKPHHLKSNLGLHEANETWNWLYCAGTWASTNQPKGNPPPAKCNTWAY